MTKLLVSVRDAIESQVAAQAGADVIDVKEPDRGALGAADAHVVRQVAQRLPPAVLLSVALGELVDRDPLSAEMIAALGQARFAKVGLAGCGNVPDWFSRWRAFLARLPAGLTPIAVAYADWHSARAPKPFDVLYAARAAGCGGLLVDTYAKGAGNLFDHLALDELTALVRAAHERGLTVALAGSLGAAQLHTVARLGADLFAVRGAVCQGGRNGRVDATQVHRLATLLKRRSSALPLVS